MLVGVDEILLAGRCCTKVHGRVLATFCITVIRQLNYLAKLFLEGFSLCKQASILLDKIFRHVVISLCLM